MVAGELENTRTPWAKLHAFLFYTANRLRNRCPRHFWHLIWLHLVGPRCSLLHGPYWPHRPPFPWLRQCYSEHLTTDRLHWCPVDACNALESHDRFTAEKRPRIRFNNSFRSGNFRLPGTLFPPLPIYNISGLLFHISRHTHYQVIDSRHGLTRVVRRSGATWWNDVLPPKCISSIRDELTYRHARLRQGRLMSQIWINRHECYWPR